MNLEKLELDKRNMYGRVREKMEMLESYIKRDIENFSFMRLDADNGWKPIKDKDRYDRITKHIESLKEVLNEIPKIENDILRIGIETTDIEEYEEPQWLTELLESTEWISTSEATDRWGLGESTLRSAIRRGQFEKGEYRKSGSVWLVRESAMKRLYGEPKGKLDSGGYTGHKAAANKV